MSNNNKSTGEKNRSLMPTKPTAELCWEIYNFVNDWKNGEYGEVPLHEAIAKSNITIKQQ